MEVERVRRIAVFVFYDPEGIVDSYVASLLAGIRPYTDRFIVCNGRMGSGREKHMGLCG